MSEHVTAVPATSGQDVAPASTDDLMLVITREFQAPIARVWSALTDADQAEAWWGPRGFHVPRESIDADLEIGGLYRACMVRDSTGRNTGGAASTRTSNRPISSSSPTPGTSLTAPAASRPR